MPDPTQTEPSHGRASGNWLVKLPEAARVDRLAELNADLLSDRSARGRRLWWTIARFAATFCIGVAVTLAWPYCGDAARLMIANASPQLGWLAPQVASGLAPDPALAAVPAPPPHAAPSDLDAVQERIDRIAASQEQMTRTVAQLAAGQAQIAQEIAKIREVEQYLLYKTSYKGSDASPPRRPPVPGHRPRRLSSVATR